MTRLFATRSGPQAQIDASERRRIEEPWPPAAPLAYEPWKHGTFKPVSRSSLEAWRSELSESQVWLIELIARGTMQHYGYEPSSFDWRTARRSAPQVAREISRWIAFKMRERGERQGSLEFSNRAKLLQALWQLVAGR